MADFLKALFDPGKQAGSALGQLGGLAGQQGGRFGHLGEEFGDLGKYQEAFSDKDYFDPIAYYDVTTHFDPLESLKRY